MLNKPWCTNSISPLKNTKMETKMTVYFSVFFFTFTKGNNFCNFLFASLDDEALPKMDLLLKERICSYWSKFFPLKVDLLRRSQKWKWGVVSPESLFVYRIWDILGHKYVTAFLSLFTETVRAVSASALTPRELIILLAQSVFTQT